MKNKRKNLRRFIQMVKGLYYSENSYAGVKQKQIKYEKEKPRQFTWDQLENLNSNYFVTNRDDDFNPKDFIDFEDGYDSDDGLMFVENKNDNITNNSTRIHDSITNSSHSENKINKQNNALRSSKSVTDKIIQNAKEIQSYSKPPKYRESVSKGEKRVISEDMANVHKNDLMSINKSMVIDNKDIINRAKVYEKQLEDRKDKVNYD